MNINFKAEKDGDLFSYHFVSGYNCDNEIICKEDFNRFKSSEMDYRDTLIGTTLHQYLSFAAFIVAQKEKYLLIRYSPESELHFRNCYSFKTHWRYLELANDFEGNGTDKGFIKSAQLYSTYKTESPYEVEKLSEDIFEEEYSNVSIFGLNAESIHKIHKSLSSDLTPNVNELITSDELFLNIVCGKRFGYFDSIVVKSKIDLEEDITEFKNVTDAGN